MTAFAVNAKINFGCLIPSPLTLAATYPDHYLTLYTYNHQTPNIARTIK
jgi:hypothetical protein